MSGPARTLRNLVKPALWSAFARWPLARLITWRGNRATRSIALTFDDGPNPDYTPRILDILAEHDAVATFFVLGQRVERYPELMRQIAAAGHEIGIHGWDHTRDALDDQADRTRRALAGVGVRTDLFRPPGGYWTVPILLRIARLGLTTVMWSIDSYDSRRGKDGIRAADAEYDQMRAGDIILFHDDNQTCVDELPRVLVRMRERQLRASAVSELLRR